MDNVMAAAFTGGLGSIGWLGQHPGDLDFVGPLTPEQQAAVNAQNAAAVSSGQEANIKDFFYQQGLMQGAQDTTPLVWGVAIVAVVLMLLTSGKR